MQTPLAWLRRKPGQTPLTSWKVSVMRACVRRPGERQPATKAKHPTTPKTAALITASLTIAPLLAKDENRYGVDKSGSFGTVRSLVPVKLSRIGRDDAARQWQTREAVLRSVQPGREATPAVRLTAAPTLGMVEAARSLPIGSRSPSRT